MKATWFIGLVILGILFAITCSGCEHVVIMDQSGRVLTEYHGTPPQVHGGPPYLATPIAVESHNGDYLAPTPLHGAHIVRYLNFPNVKIRGEGWERDIYYQELQENGIACPSSEFLRKWQANIFAPPPE